MARKEQETITACKWCGEEFDENELYNTDLGELCAKCVHAIRSKGESITIILGTKRWQTTTI